MKKILLMISCTMALHCHAQRYLLLDTHISEAPFYANQITPADKVKGFFPVEEKDIPAFISILEEIREQLTEKKVKPAKQYSLGCIVFKGQVFNLAAKKSLDYVLISTCEHIKIEMHLCDGRIGNADNAYFVDTWIKYIKSAFKK